MVGSQKQINLTRKRRTVFTGNHAGLKQKKKKEKRKEKNGNEYRKYRSKRKMLLGERISLSWKTSHPRNGILFGVTEKRGSNSLGRHCYLSPLGVTAHVAAIICKIDIKATCWALTSVTSLCNSKCLDCGCQRVIAFFLLFLIDEHTRMYTSVATRAFFKTSSTNYYCIIKEE